MKDHNIPVKNGKAIVYKIVTDDFKTQKGRENEFLYPIGKTVETKDWRPREAECGAGKLHACDKPISCNRFRGFRADTYIAIQVDLKDCYVWDEYRGKYQPRCVFPEKIAFRKGKVLYEVNRYTGEKI